MVVMEQKFIQPISTVNKSLFCWKEREGGRERGREREGGRERETERERES